MDTRLRSLHKIGVIGLTKKLVLIDGNSIAYRAFFALPLLNNDKGIHTNAIYGFTMMLMKILEDEKPTHILVAFDAGKTTFRHKTLANIKVEGKKLLLNYQSNFHLFVSYLMLIKFQDMNLKIMKQMISLEPFPYRQKRKAIEVKVISGDKDLTQFSSPKTTVGITRKGITDIEEYTPAHIEEKYGLAPEQIIDMKGLMGDNSDNIPGVPGVGEKTAIKLLKEFHTLEELIIIH